MWRQQSIRFIIVGLTSNLLLYLLFLILTSLGVGHKSAMTILFMVGVSQTYLLNHSWTFQFFKVESSTFFKYVSIYGFAYLLNLVVLTVFVDHWKFPHQIVQGIAIPSLAALLFILQKFWVFRVSATV